MITTLCAALGKYLPYGYRCCLACSITYSKRTRSIPSSTAHSMACWASKSLWNPTRRVDPQCLLWI